MLGATHTTVVVTITWAVLCLLLAQQATPAALARALPAEQAGSGRSCLRRVRRWWAGPPLDQVTISRQLVEQALACLPAGAPIRVALDTTRLGQWEVWLAGVRGLGGSGLRGWSGGVGSGHAASVPGPPDSRVRLSTEPAHLWTTGVEHLRCAPRPGIR